jgi:broad specificity phosphatase PhoE
MKHLYFMRHGLSVSNMRGLLSGRDDTPLANEGIKQCEAAAKLVSKLNIDAIVSSPMQRAKESAKIIAKAIGYPEDKIIISELFMEREFGPLEGANYYHYRHQNLDDSEGVEHSSAIINRAKQGYELLQGIEADNILVVSHGALGRALRHVINPDIDFHHSEGFNNAEVVQLL